MADSKNPGGRPEFEVTDELRDRVEWYIAAGMKRDDVARAIGCTKNTLDKHFEDQILNGWARKKAAILDLMIATAKDGNASIQKRLEQIISTTGAAQKFEAEVPKQEPLGKKQQAVVDAKTAGLGTDWGDDLKAPVILHS